MLPNRFQVPSTSNVHIEQFLANCKPQSNPGQLSSKPPKFASDATQTINSSALASNLQEMDEQDNERCKQLKKQTQKIAPQVKNQSFRIKKVVNVTQSKIKEEPKTEKVIESVPLHHSKSQESVKIQPKIKPKPEPLSQPQILPPLPQIAPPLPQPTFQPPTSSQPLPQLISRLLAFDSSRAILTLVSQLHQLHELLSQVSQLKRIGLASRISTSYILDLIDTREILVDRAAKLVKYIIARRENNGVVMELEEEILGLTDSRIQELFPDTPSIQHKCCSICMVDIDDKMKVLQCKHEFHPECVAQWLKLRITCPVCRKQQKLK